MESALEAAVHGTLALVPFEVPIVANRLRTSFAFVADAVAFASSSVVVEVVADTSAAADVVVGTLVVAAVGCTFPYVEVVGNIVAAVAEVAFASHLVTSSWVAEVRSCSQR